MVINVLTVLHLYNFLVGRTTHTRHSSGIAHVSTPFLEPTFLRTIHSHDKKQRTISPRGMYQYTSGSVTLKNVVQSSWGEHPHKENLSDGKMLHVITTTKTYSILSVVYLLQGLPLCWGSAIVSYSFMITYMHTCAHNYV